MQHIQALRERRVAKAVEARKILDAHKEDWKAEYGDQVETLYREIDDIDTQISLHQRAADLAAERSFSDVPKAAFKEGDLDPKSPKAIFNKWLRQGDRAVSAEEWGLIRNTMSTTTSSEGGYTVQTDIARSIADALKAYGGMRRVAEVFTTEQGNPMNFPTSDGTSETGEQIAENTTATGADPTFGSIALNVYKFSSKIVAVPFELLQDSSVDIEAFVRNRLVTRLGRIMNTRFTTGTGSSQPLGLTAALSTGKTGTTGQTTSVIYDDLVDLIDSVDAGYLQGGASLDAAARAPRLSWMMAQSSRKVIRKIKDSQNRPLWVPDNDMGLTNAFTDTLLGYPVILNNDMPAMAANAKSIAFGDLSYYKVRDAMDITMFRFTDSAYAKLGQVGFLAWARSGGTWVDVGGAAKLYVNSAT